MESCIPGTWALQGHGREGDAALVLKLLIGWTKACEELVVPWLDLQRKLRSVARGTGISQGNCTQIVQLYLEVPRNGGMATV